MTIPIGSIVHYSQIDPPSLSEPWFACNGELLHRDEYEPLFAVIGGAFGDGDKVHSFALPDLRGYFVRGVNVSPNPEIPKVSPRGPELEGEDREAMAAGGNTGEKVGSVQGSALFSHRHGIRAATFGFYWDNWFKSKATTPDGGVVGETMREGSSAETRPINAAFSYMILANESKQHFPLYGIIGYGGDKDPPATVDGEEWKICDGRTIPSSPPAGSVSLPDLRGCFLRCMDDCGGRGSAGRDPEASTTRYLPGTRTPSTGLGSFQGHELEAHAHKIAREELSPFPGQSKVIATAEPGSDSVGPTGATGAEETRPINACLHYIMRVA